MDPYGFDDQAALRAELRLGFAVDDPRALVHVPTEGLPEPLKPSAEAMLSGNRDERKAAASEFLLLSEEFVDRPPSD